MDIRNGLIWLMLIPCSHFAQSGLDTTVLKQLDAGIERFEQTGPLDSLVLFYRQKTQILKEADELAAWVSTYLDLGLTDPDHTLSYLDSMQQQMWRLPRDSTEKEALVWCYMYQGYYLKEGNDILGSARAYEKALKWYADCSPEDFDILEWVIKPLGNHYTRLGDNEKAINLFVEAIEFASGRYSAGSLAGLYNNLGLAYWNQAKYQFAIEEYQKGLALPELPASSRALLLSNLAGSYFDKGDLAQAVEAAQQADQLFGSMGPTTLADRQVLAWICGNKKILGQIYLEEKKYETAGRFFEEAMATGLRAFWGSRNRQLGKIYIAKGQLEQLEGKLNDALRSFNLALQAVIPSFQSEVPLENPDRAALYEENTIFEALEAKADVLLKKFDAEDKTEYLQASLECHQLASQVEGLLRQTYQYQSSKLDLQQQSRQRSEQAIEVAYLLYSKTGDPAYIISAFNFAQQNKATILLEAVKKNLALKRTNLRDSLFAVEQQLKNLNADYSRRILEARQTGNSKAIVEQLETRKRKTYSQLQEVTLLIEKRYPSLKQMKEQLEPVAFGDLQIALSDRSCELLEFFEGRNDIYLFYISEQELPQLKKISLADSVQAVLQSFRNYFVSSKVIANDPEGFLSRAFEVYQLLGLSFAGNENSGQSAKLLISPDGQLNLIPFEALLTGAPKGPNLADAPYLIKSRSIYYAYSVTLWHTQLDRMISPAARSMLAVAPVFSGGESSLPPLEHSYRSSKKLASTIRNSQILAREEASLGNFKRLGSTFSILHLATHASSNEQETPPRIAFIDSTLYLPEIHALSIPAELVVLSACETGLGKLQPGEGVMSLARSFFYAGAGGLISSLWTVNDHTTSELFLSFYDKLLKKQPLSLALQEAKLEYLEDPNISDAQKSPYYWAGFVFVGHDKALDLKPSNQLPAWSLVFLGLFILAALWQGLRWRAAVGRNPS